MGRFWVVCITVLVGSAATVGCGSSEAGDPTQQDILEMLHASQRNHDPVNFEEIDLGEFFITRENAKGLPLMVRFQAFAVVHSKNKETFQESLDKHKHTLRDAIRAQVQATEPDYLNDAKLDWLRNQLRPLVNRTLQTQDCRDVIFPNWELEEPIHPT